MNIVAETVMTSDMPAHAGNWHGGPWFLLFPLAWIVVIVVIAVIFKRRRGPWHHHNGAEAVLRERFARGEVTEEEYRQRMEVLRGK